MRCWRRKRVGRMMMRRISFQCEVLSVIVSAELNLLIICYEGLAINTN
jgi:hypothetical protein